MKVNLPIDAPLEVIEDDTRCHVVVAGDADDWLVLFDKWAEPASRDWADNFVSIYNKRYELANRRPQQ